MNSRRRRHAKWIRARGGVRHPRWATEPRRPLRVGDVWTCVGTYLINPQTAWETAEPFDSQRWGEVQR